MRNFSRYHKYTLGSELRAQGREIVGVVIAANSRVEKLPLLLELREKLERLQVLHSETALACQITVSREVRCGSNWDRRQSGGVRPEGRPRALTIPLHLMVSHHTS